MTDTGQSDTSRFGFRGAVTAIFGQWGRVAIQLVALVVLARILSPADYGLMAIVAGIVNVANLFCDGGLSGAALQASSLSHHQRSNLLWANLGLGAVLSVALGSCATLVGQIYGDPDLTRLCLLISPVFIINGLAAQYRIALNRDGRFLAISVIDLVGALAGLAIGIACALRGLGAIALIAQQLTGATVTAGALVIAQPWLPAWPRRHVGTRPLIRFGGMWLATMLANSVSSSVTPLALGWYQPASVVGSFNRALQIAQQPTGQLLGPLTRLAVPRAVRVGEDSKARALSLYAVHSPASTVTSAVLSILVAASTLAGTVLLGDQWRSIGLIIAILAVSGFVQTAQQISYWLLFSSGNSRLLFLSEIIPRLVFVLSIIVCARFGVIPVCVAVVLLQVMILLVGCLFALPVIGISRREALARSLSPVAYFLAISLVILAGKAVLLFGLRIDALVVDWLAIAFWSVAVGASAVVSARLRRSWLQAVRPILSRLPRRPHSARHAPWPKSPQGIPPTEDPIDPHI